jgi:hypothetical protein
MKMRKSMLVAAAASLALGAASQAHAGRIDLAVSTSPYSDAVPEIIVDGPTATGVYDEVLTKTLDYIVSVRGDRPKRPKGGGHFWIDLGGVREGGQISGDWKNYKLSAPYVAPRSNNIVNERISPIDVCNDNLALKSKHGLGDKFRKEGLSFTYHDAYEIEGLVHYGTNTLFKAAKHYTTSILVPVKIRCMPLGRIRPKHDTSTTGAPGPKGKPLPPTVSNATFRIEPAKVVQDGKFLCPSELKLYGHVEVIRKFYGKALFVGPHYLSAITTLNFQAEGSRNVTATYDMDWHKMGGFTTAPNAEPEKQKLTFHFNVADKDGKLRKSVEETVEVSCKKITVAVPTVGDEMTVKPAN